MGNGDAALAAVLGIAAGVIAAAAIAQSLSKTTCPYCNGVFNRQLGMGTDFAKCPRCGNSFRFR
jgi:tRNA(Ile2) C34 agmatinyltransferase TiaS